MTSGIPIAERVMSRLSECPPQMAADLAAGIIAAHKLSESEIAWIITDWEHTKPRVHRRTVSDGVNVRDGAS